MLLRLNSSTSLYMNVHVVLWWKQLILSKKWNAVTFCVGGVCRYKPPSTESNPTLEDPTPDYMNLLGMIFSMCGLMLKVTYDTHKHTHLSSDSPRCLVLCLLCVCVCVVCVSTTKGELPLNGGPWSGPGVPFRRLKVNSPFRWKDGGQLLTFSTEDTIKTTKRAVPDQAHVASLSNRGELV